MMILMKLFKTLILSFWGVLWLLVGQSCTPQKNAAVPKAQSGLLSIDSSFIARSINDIVLVATKVTEKDLTRKNLKEWIADKTIAVNQRRDAITVGPYRQYPEAWFYTQIVNNDSQNRQLVIDEFDHIRCDVFEVFTTKNGVVQKWGSINRLSPFSEYPIPYLTYAIPLTINAKDTLSLLIHTKRHYGRHEVNLGVSSYKTYIGTNIYDFLSKIFQIILFVLCIFLMFILGWFFEYQMMIYLGYFLFALLFVHLASWGFTDALMTFKGIGLSADNSGTFTVFISNALLLLFLRELMKVVPKNERVFMGIFCFLTGINLFGMACFFLPASVFPRVDAFFFLPQLMLLATLANLLWIFYCSLLALYKIRAYYMIVGFGIAFLPIFFQQLYGFFAKSTYLLVQVYHPTYITEPLGLTVICIYLLQGQLVSRKKLRAELSQLKESMEDLRRNEIEGIGRNLHDNVGNMLASVLGYVNLKNQNTEVIKTLLKDSINEVRVLSHTLVKQEDLPITEKLEMLVSRFNDFAAIDFYFNDFAEKKLNRIEHLRQQNLYMIVQETMTNVVKHSKATEVHIQVFENDGVLQVAIEDDGVGMPSGSTKEGIGLKNIYKRAELSAFKVMLDSNETGTHYIIEIHENNNYNSR
jgi:signal transduction histidine kinase